MASPIWSDKEQRWRYDVTHDGERKVLLSTKPGRPGLLEVNRKKRDWENSTDSNILVKKLWEKFLVDVKARSSPENYRNVEIIGRLYILPKVGAKKYTTMKTTGWQEIINTAEPVGWKRENKETIVKSKALSKKTLSNIRGVIISFGKFAELSEIGMPIKTLYVPKSAQVVGKGILQPDALKRLFEAPAADYWYLNAWKLMAVTGLRPGECYGIKKSDMQNGSLVISRSVNARGRITEGKNKNAHRQIVLHKIALGVINEQLEKIEMFDTEWLFPNREGNMPLQSVAFKGWQRFCKNHDISVSPYCLRHTFISMVKNDMPAEMVKAIVGHSAAMDTFGVYGHEVDGEASRSAKILDITFKKALGNKVSK